MNLASTAPDTDWLQTYPVLGYDFESKAENDNYI